MYKSVIKYIVVIILLFAVITIIINILDNTTIYVTNNNEKEYNSINEINNPNIKIPKFIVNQNNLNIKESYGRLIQINNNDLILKIDQFIDIDADILGIYSESDIDDKYIVSNNSISYLRYRTGNKDYKESTIVNWVNGQYTYGLMMNGLISLSDALKLLNINENDINKTIIKNSNDEDINSEKNGLNFDTINYSIDNKTSIVLPKFNSNYSIKDLDNTIICTIDDKIIFGITDIDSHGVLDNQGIKNINSTKCIKYRLDNPFKEGTTQFDDFNNLMTIIEKM